MVLSQMAIRYPCLAICWSICDIRVYVKCVDIGRKQETYDRNGIGEVRADAQVLAAHKVEHHGLGRRSC